MRRWFKRMSVIALVTVLVVSLAAPGVLAAPKGKTKGHGKKFLDIDEVPWASEAVSEMAAKGIIKGYPGGYAMPGKPVTHIEALVMALRIMGWEHEGVQQRDGLGDYLLGKGTHQWSIVYILLALQKGIITEGEVATTNFQAPAKRCDVAMYITRALGLEEEAEELSGVSLPFVDAASIPAWAVGYIAVMVQRGIMLGDLAGTFRPHAPVKRAEMALLLARLDKITPPSAAKVVGTVTRVEVGPPARITVKPELGAEKSYEVDEDAEILVDGEEASLGDIGVGFKAEIRLDEQGVAIYISAQTPGVSAGGTVLAVTTGAQPTIRIKSPAGQEATYSVSPTAKVVFGTQSLTLGAVTVGSKVELVLRDNVVVEIKITHKAETISGVIKAVRLASVIITVSKTADGTTVFEDRVVYVDSGTVITKDGQPATLAKLAAGMKATAVGLLSSAGKFTATRLDASTLETEVVGIVTKVTLGPPPKITLRLSTGQEVTYQIAPDAELYVDGIEASLGDIGVGYQAEVRLNEQRLAVYIDARTTTAVVSGVVAAVTTGAPPTIKITRTDGGQATYGVAATAEITFGTQTIALSAITVGSEVELELRDNLVAEIRVKRLAETITGTIKAVRLASLIVTVAKQVGGGTVFEDRVVYVTAATVIKKDGATTNLAGLEAGLKVTVAGMVSGTGTFTATRIEATTPETEVAGVVLAVTTGTEPTIKIRTAAGREPTYKVSATATITLDGKAATLGEIIPGDSATLKVDGEGVATSIAATAATTEVTGLVLAVTTGGSPTIKVKKADDTEATFNVSPTATVRFGIQNLELADVRLESRVKLVLKRSVVVEIQVLEMADSFSGTIKSIDISGILVITVTTGGATRDRTVHLTNQTVITRDGSPATLSSLAVGMKATATGRVDTAGKFVATRVDATTQ